MRSGIRGMLGLIIMSLRNLRQRKVRTLLTIIGITIGVAAMISASITQETAKDSISDAFGQAAGDADLIVTNATASIGDTEGFDADALEDVRETTGVELAAPLMQLTTSSPLELEDWEHEYYISAINGTLLFGIDPEFSSNIGHYDVISGDNLSEDTTDGALVSQSYADSLGIGLGDTLQLVVPGGLADFHVTGLIDSTGLSRLNRGKVVLAKLETVAVVTGRPGKLDQIDVAAGTDIDKEQLKQDLEILLGDKYNVSLPQVKGAQADDMAQIVATSFGFMAMLITGIGIFLIYNTFATIMAERSREIGLMRAIGTGKSHLIGMILGEAYVLGVVGTLLGIPLGIGLAYGMAGIIEEATNTPMNNPTILPEHLIYAFIVGVGVAFIASLIPAIQSGRLSPMEALKQHDEINRRLSWKMLSSGLTMLIFAAIIYVYHIFGTSDISFEIAFGLNFIVAIGIVLVLSQIMPAIEGLLGRIMRIFKIYGEIGGRNLARRPLRTALTVGILAIGIASIVLLGGEKASYNEWAEDYIDTWSGSDLLVFSPQPFPQEIVEDIDTMPGVSEATGVGFIPASMVDPNESDEVGGIFSAFDPLVANSGSWDFQWVEFAGSKAEAIAMLESGSAVFIESYTSQHYGLGIGDSITLGTLEGKQSFEIAAIINGHQVAGFCVFGSWDQALQYFGTNNVDFAKVNLNSGYDIPTIESDILNQWGQTYHIKTETYEHFRARIMSDLNETLNTVDAMVLIGIIIVVMAIINTLMMSVWERRRELGMLGAVGMTRKQLIGIITTEALALGLLGGVIGIGLGLLSLPTVIEGFTSILGLGLEFQFVFPAQSVIIAIAVALIMPVAAGLLPAWHGTRTVIAEVMRTE